MDLLRALLRLPLLIWNVLAGALRWLLRTVLGEFYWREPQWALALQARTVGVLAAMRRHPRRSWGVFGALALCALAGMAGYQWYRNQPRPPQPVPIEFSVAAPAASSYDEDNDKLVVHPLRLRFSASAAPIERVGKPVLDGIRMRPALAGSWTWDDDRTLHFQPAEDWPVGQHYKVDFDAARAFAPQVLMARDGFAFDSPAFVARIVKAEFHQDPQDAALKKAIVQLRFSHPVDPLTFEKRIRMALRHGKDAPAPRKFVINYDERKFNAWVHSEPLALPLDPGTLQIRIDKGVQAARGGPGTPDPIEVGVAVPGLYSLALSGVDATLVDNARFEPEQVLVLAFSEAVGERDAQARTRAWLLPEFHPDTLPKDRKRPYRWADAEVGEALLAKSQALDLEPIAAERDFGEVQSFKYHAAPGRYLYVQVDKGLTSFGGYVLGKRTANVVQVPNYPRLLRFMSDGALLSLSGERRVAVVARNQPGMRLEVARILPDQLQHLVGFNYGPYAKPELGALSRDAISERFVRTTAFPDVGPAQAHYEGVDLSEYLDDPTRRGIFLLRLYAQDPNLDRDYADSEYREPEDARLIVVTDLGLLAKKSLDGSYDVFVQSIHSGAAVADAQVQVLAKNGQVLLSERSDADGRVHLASLAAYTREKTPALFVVRHGEDLSFLPVEGADRQLDFSRFDVGGIGNATDAGQLTAHVFSDRGLYRPGDTFHIGMIVRAADWARSLAGVPLEADIIDPRGMRVARRVVTLGALGFEELAYTPQETAPTGEWTINLSLVKDDDRREAIGATTVQVKEFLPDRMKATATLSAQVAEGWVKPEGLRARVLLQNLFGTPAVERRVEATLTLSPVFPAFPSHPDYRFFDPQHAREGYSESLGEQRTDANGEAVFKLDLEKYARATYRLHFLAKGYEAEGGRSVAAETVGMVSSLDYLVGVKADGDLDYIKRDARRVASVIAIDPQARKIAVAGLTAVLLERRYVSILTKQDSGVYKYESRRKEVQINARPLTIPAAGLGFDLPTATPGSFAWVVRDARGEELNRIEYAVAGDANLSRSLERNAELQLTLDKRDYQPGEEIAIAIRAPYAGSGVITIERERVFAYVRFHADTTGSVQRIRVPADFEGNGYVNVQFVRDPSSDEIFMSPLSYGVAPFSVNRDARELALTVTAPASIKPGQTLGMRVHTPGPARVAVFAVDEGILQVARYTLADPLDHFFRKRALEVQTSQILDLILPEFARLTAMAAAGGDADGLLGKFLNPFRKKRQPPVAYWSGLVEVDGSRELRWTVPEDFNGRLRVMAVAVAADRIGTFETATTVRGDFVLSPNVPSMVAPGDEFEISVGVANNLTGLGGKTVPVSVTLAPSAQVEAIGAGTQVLQLAEMREGVALFRLRAKDAPGVATLTFTASSGTASARLAQQISVRPAVPYRTELAVGHLDAGSAEITPLRTMFDAHAKREAAVSHVPLVLARGLGAYLADFPHRCTEQLLSQGVAELVFAARPEFTPAPAGAADDAIGDVAPATAADRYAALLAVLRSRQNGEGGFGLWTATPQSSRYVSAYAVQFLLEARERGRAVPDDMLERGNSYLRQLASDASDASLAGLRERAFAIYLLSRQGRVMTSQLAAVRQQLQQNFGESWHDDIAAAYLAASFKLLQADREADTLIAGPAKVLARKAVAAAYVFERYNDPLVRDAGTLYLLARHFPQRLKALPPQSLQNIVQALRLGQFNTLSSALTVLALDAYGTQAAAVGADTLTLAAVAADGTSRAIGTTDGLVTRGSFSAAAKSVRVGNSADLPAWYSVSQAGFDRTPPTAVRKDGLEIVREYTDAEGNVVDSVVLGEELQVHLKIRATRADGLDDIVIVDLLPGGFEPVQEVAPAAAAEGDGDGTAVWRSPVGLSTSSWQPQYADVREDRVVIYGYAGTDVQAFVYRIKSTNAGTFAVPPAYGESMYDRSVQAQSLGGTITVVRKPAP